MKENMINIRTKTVRKANALVQKSRFNLSVTEQKIILYIISKISPFDSDFKLYEFSIYEFMKVCGIEKGGNTLAEIKQILQEISKKQMWITLESGEMTLARWIEKPYISPPKEDEKGGIIRIKLDADMKPFLLELKANYFSYELLWILHMHSKYSIRLYELIKSYHYNELKEYNHYFDLEDLKKMLGAEHYKTWQKFKEKAFERAIAEINRYSDKVLRYEIKKSGKKVVGITLFISTKNISERANLYYEISEDLGYNQMMLEGFDNE